MSLFIINVKIVTCFPRSQWDCICFAICLPRKGLLFVEWTILFKGAFLLHCPMWFTGMHHLLTVARHSPWCMSVALAVNGPHPRISPQTTGEKTALHVPGPPLVWAGADGCRPERLAVSSEGLCCHVISRVLFHVDVHTHQNTHRWKRLAASYFPIQLRCGKHIWLLLVFKLSVSCHFRTAMVCNWYCLTGPTLSVLALEFAAILRSLFFQQKPSYLTWKYENSVVKSRFSKSPFFSSLRTL